MKTYCLRIKPLAPWSTHWHADTLFAALAWQVAQRVGVPALRQMIEAFRTGQPPFIISGGFPEGWLPCPLSASLQQLPSLNLKAKLPAWVTEEQFRTLITQPAPLLPQESWSSPVALSRTLHASIDRSSGTTDGEGNLFEIETWYMKSTDTNPEAVRQLTVFFRTEDWSERLHDLFRTLGSQGFGKKRSIGHGAFEVVGDPEPCEWLDQFEGADAFVSLSHFVPAAGDPTDGRWNLVVKYPKFLPEAPVLSPFKGRLLMLCPGSVFRVGGKVQPVYGKVIEGISRDFPEAIHYALAFPVPIKWPQEGTNE